MVGGCCLLKFFWLSFFLSLILHTHTHTGLLNSVLSNVSDFYSKASVTIKRGKPRHKRILLHKSIHTCCPRSPFFPTFTNRKKEALCSTADSVTVTEDEGCPVPECTESNWSEILDTRALLSHTASAELMHHSSQGCVIPFQKTTEIKISLNLADL